MGQADERGAGGVGRLTYGIANEDDGGHGFSRDFFVRVNHICQANVGTGGQRQRDKSDAKGESDPVDLLSGTDAIQKAPEWVEEQRDEGNPKSGLGLLDALVSAGQLFRDDVAEPARQETTHRGADNCREIYQADFVGVKVVWRVAKDFRNGGVQDVEPCQDATHQQTGKQHGRESHQGEWKKEELPEGVGLVGRS